MNKEQLVKEFISAVDYMKTTKFNGTYYWILGSDEKNDWAIVLGWSGGFEPDEHDDCMDGTYCLCAKVAFQPNNSIMQCDYEVDWIMPYNEQTGEVDDNEISIFSGCDLDYVVNWLLDCYATYNIAED